MSLLNSIYRKTFAEINLSHLKNNYLWIKNNFPENVFICPMVKSNAYGHGDMQIALELEKLGVSQLGVCLIEEGLKLKSEGIKTSLLVFGGFDLEGAKVIVEQNLVPVVSQWNQIDYLEKSVTSKPINVHLKFDTGMNRLGFSPKDAKKLLDRFWQNKKLRLKGVLTHLHSAEDFLREESTANRQLLDIKNIANEFKSLSICIHALNSGGIWGSYLKKSITPYWGLRPGLMLYGYVPDMNGHKKTDNFFKPVMTLKSQVLDIKDISKGAGVSYSHSWVAERDTRVAIISIGYGDGVHRVLSNKNKVLINGQFYPMVGTICMDYLMVDIGAWESTSHEKINVGSEVILFGADTKKNIIYGADNLATSAKTITWEILTSVGERVPRVYISSSACET